MKCTSGKVSGESQARSEQHPRTHHQVPALQQTLTCYLKNIRLPRDKVLPVPFHIGQELYCPQTNAGQLLWAQHYASSTIRLSSGLFDLPH